MAVEKIDTINAMTAELEAADAIFLPGAFWDDLNQKNLSMLEAEGLANFKRTVSQNYFNWFIASPRHVLFRHAFKQWALHPDFLPFSTQLKETARLRFTTEDGQVSLSNIRRLLYRLYVCFVWNIMARNDRDGLRYKLTEPEVGNPFRIMHGHQLLSQDLASSILECNVLSDLVSCDAQPRIAEIGAGYGRVAHAYANTLPGQYYIFDIPPALAVAQWYLQETLGVEKVFAFRHFERLEDVEESMRTASVVMLTPNQIRKFPDGYFDVTLSISSLPEMRRDQVDLYLSEFQRLSKGHIFLKQFKAWKNPSDGTDLNMESYCLGPEWQITLDRTDPIVPFFFNRVWSRRPTPL